MELLMRTFAAIILSRPLGFLGVCMANPLAWLGACIPLISAYYISIRRIDIEYSKKKSCLYESDIDACNYISK